MYQLQFIFQDCSSFVTVYSSVKDLPAVTVYHIIHNPFTHDQTFVVSATPWFHIRAPGKIHATTLALFIQQIFFH